MNFKIKNNGVFEDVVIKGLKGEDGVGMPKGGTTGQLLQKNSNSDFDFSWITLQATKSVDVSVATSAWTSDTTYSGYAYKATVTANGVTATNNIIVGLSAASSSSQEEACINAGVKCKSQATNQITLYAKSKPTVALTISIIILG